MDEQIPLAKGQEQRLRAAREGRRNGGPSRGEDRLGGYRYEMTGEVYYYSAARGTLPDVLSTVRRCGGGGWMYVVGYSWNVGTDAVLFFGSSAGGLQMVQTSDRQIIDYYFMI